MKSTFPSFVFIAIPLLTSVVEPSKDDALLQNTRQMRGFRGPSPDYDKTEYPFCKASNVVGACLEGAVCAAEKGRFMGYCGFSDGVCCEVIKSCGTSSSSHAVRFQNPSFPEAETESKICTFKLHIGRGICAVRMEHDVFEFKVYRKDYCPTDTFNILGTKKLVAPLCGNMTGWETTFEVEPYTTIDVAVVAQGKPPFKFSTLFTTIPCKDIVSLRSPTNAGLVNTDAEEYIPPTTTTAKPSSSTSKSTESTKANGTSEESTTQAITEKSEETETTTVASETTTAGPEEGTGNSSSTPLIPSKRDEEGNVVTPLPVGEIRTKATPESVIARYISSHDEEFDDQELEEVSEFFDPTPDSVLKRIFDEKVGDKCRTYDEVGEENSYKTPHPHSVDRSNIDKCWFYDFNSGTYKVNEECEKEAERASFSDLFRIIGGKLTNKNEYPWQVALIYKKKFFCGGALVSDRHVLTASHCVFGSFSSGIHNLEISLGDHDLKTKNETNNILMGVKKVIWNLHYSSDTTENDIGILELKEPVDFSYNIMPVNLPTDLSNTYAGQNVTVTGWGRNSLRTKKTSSILKEYTAPVDDIDKCVNRWKAYPSISAIKGMHICFNVTYGTPCHGDSGGPLVACNEGRRCTLIGIVSFGFPLCRNVGLPAVFTRVTTFKRWIDINTTPLFFHGI